MKKRMLMRAEARIEDTLGEEESERALVRLAAELDIIVDRLSSAISPDEPDALAELALDHLPLERAHEVNQELAGEVVVLVQHAACEQRFALDLEHLAVDAAGTDARCDRPLDWHEDVREGQAALVGLLGLCARPDYLGVDEGERIVMCVAPGQAGMHDEYLRGITDLDGCDAKAIVCVHGIHKIAIERTYLVGDLGDLASVLAQTGIWPHHDRSDCHAALPYHSAGGHVQGTTWLPGQAAPPSRRHGLREGARLTKEEAWDTRQMTIA